MDISTILRVLIMINVASLLYHANVSLPDLAEEAPTFVVTFRSREMLSITIVLSSLAGLYIIDAKQDSRRCLRELAIIASSYCLSALFPNW